MNIKLIFFTIFFASMTCLAWGSDNFARIRDKQYVSCGINPDYPQLAYKDDDGLKGMDVEICKAFAAAILDDAEKIKLFNVPTSKIGQALNSGKIDIMLGHTLLTPSQEITQQVLLIDTIYFDRQIFAARTITQASSMRDFTEAKVCVLRNSPSAVFLKAYNLKYALGFKLLEMPDLEAAKQAFYLNRCDLISGSEIFITELVNNFRAKQPAEILPEDIAYLPIKAYSAGNNPELNTSFRWIINALKLAQAENINMQNIDTFTATKDPVLQNLLGINPNTWQILGLVPDWVKNYIKAYGNYQQILERNLGSSSKLNLDMKPNNLLEDGGFLTYQSFI